LDAVVVQTERRGGGHDALAVVLVVVDSERRRHFRGGASVHGKGTLLWCGSWWDYAIPVLRARAHGDRKIRRTPAKRRMLRDSAVSARLQAAVEAQVTAGASGALARIEAPRAGLTWSSSAGHLARGKSRALRPDDAFRAASVTKSVTAAVAIRVACEGRLALDEPLAVQLAPELLQRWRALDALPRTTPRQLLAHTSGVPNYFREETFIARLREEPNRVWRPVELVDHAAAHGTPSGPPGQGFEYSDTGYVVVGILLEQLTGQPLHEVYRELVFDPTRDG
jgi:D-alanyl-D-alanine carboxypeptidase